MRYVFSRISPARKYELIRAISMTSWDIDDIMMISWRNAMLALLLAGHAGAAWSCFQVGSFFKVWNLICRVSTEVLFAANSKLCIGSNHIVCAVRNPICKGQPATFFCQRKHKWISHMKSSNDPRVHYSMDLLRGALYKLHNKILVLLYIVFTDSAPVAMCCFKQNF